MQGEARAPYRVEALESPHDRRAFSCGVTELDQYIRERASQDGRRHVATTFVLLGASAVVLGYYSLSQQVINVADIPATLAARLPRYPLLPATLVGRLAVDRHHQGHGLGRLLLVDALHRSWSAAAEVASFAVRVDATDERARDFYLRHDFRAFPCERMKLFLPMADLDRLFRGR